MVNTYTHMYRTDLPEERVVEKARKRIKAKKGFFAHLVSYVSVIGFLFMINMLTSPEFWWFLFPAGGWGIGLASHYFAVFGIMGVGSRKWEERELAKEIGRLEEDPDVLLLDQGYEFPDDGLELEERKAVRRTWKDSDLV